MNYIDLERDLAAALRLLGVRADDLSLAAIVGAEGIIGAAAVFGDPPGKIAAAVKNLIEGVERLLPRQIMIDEPFPFKSHRTLAQLDGRPFHDVMPGTSA